MMQSFTPPIAASPARLGLTGTTSSPSLPPNPSPNPNPNPNPNSNPSPNPIPSTKPPPPSSAAVTTSAALLSLLPPLPRAQSLLHQMAALSTKLFEVSPNRATWLAAFRGSLPSFLPSPSPAAAAPPTPLSPSSTKEVLSLFTSLQTQLFESVAELQEILDLQNSRLSLARDAHSRDAALLAFTRKLSEAEQVLDRLVDDYADYRRDPKRAKKDQNPSPDYSSSLHSSLDLQEILSYAHRISYTTFAPPEHGAGLAPLRGALPPAPQDNEMRASQLYHFADLDVGVPKAAEAKASAADALTEPLMEPTPPREELPPPAVPPLPITVPPGWRKGMPVPLLNELPPIPPGWKPGDPIVIPPLDGVVLGSKIEEQRAGGPPAVPIMPMRQQPKAPEPIQVGYVNIEISGDSSSDYSSDVESSDEDNED